MPIDDERKPDVEVIHGDCLEHMASMATQGRKFSSIVTDPPYGLSFMGKAWDSPDNIAFRPDVWRLALGLLEPGGVLAAFGGSRTQHRMACAIEDAGFEIRDCIMWLYGTGFPKGAAQLKPSYEPIILARKPGPLRKLAIDACRIPGVVPNTIRGGHPEKHRVKDSHDDAKYLGRLKPQGFVEGNPLGRWPTNILHDGSDQILEGLGHAARFFYCSKPSRSERGESNHPTVKPLALMRWVTRLINISGGTILDPFAGSGTTLAAAHMEGFHAVGIEREEEYFKDIKNRMYKINGNSMDDVLEGLA